MNHTNTRTSQAGFSLVELMVVVAIIGVLASIAVPQVNKYIAKARQSEAKTILSSLYTSEKAFYAEYTSYDTRFGAIGYSPEGKLRYNAGFLTLFAAPVSSGYTTTLTGAQLLTSTSAYCGTAGNFNANNCAMLNGATGAAPPGLPASTASVSAFTAAGIAVIFGTASDTWTINNQKNLINTVPGIQ